MSLELAKMLVEIEAIKFNFDEGFTYASGKKGPIYCDTRRIIGHPEVRQKFVENLVSLVEQESDVQAIGAMATGGISLGSLIADRLDLPFFYVRSNKKKYGAANQIEGLTQSLANGKSCILFEDLINSGGSVNTGAREVQNFGFKLIRVISLVDYNFEVAKNLLQGLGCKGSKCLISFNDIIETIPKSEENLRYRLQKWHDTFYS